MRVELARFCVVVSILAALMLSIEALPGTVLGLKPYVQTGHWGVRGFGVEAIPHVQLGESLFIINLVHTFSWVSPLTAQIARLGEVIVCFVLYRQAQFCSKERDWWMSVGSILLSASWLSQSVSFWLRGGVVDLLYWKPEVTGVYAALSASDVGAYIGVGVLCAALVRYVVRLGGKVRATN